MKNREIELYFVHHFVNEEKGKRFFWELGLDKIRSKGIEDFNTNIDAMIKKDFIVYRGYNIQKDDIKEVLRQDCKNGKVYIISSNKLIDGTYKDIDLAVKQAVGKGMITILITQNTVFIETKQEEGPAKKYILKITEEYMG